MKKIIIINHYGITPDLPGATKHYDMAKYFAGEKKHQIEFWMCGYNHHTGRNHEKLKGLRLQYSTVFDNLKMVKIKSTPYRKSGLLRQINHTIFDFITAIKVLFARNVDAIILSVPPISVFNVLAINIRRIALITDVEDLWPLFLKDIGMKNRVVLGYMDFFSRYTYNSSTAIAPVSCGMANYVKGVMKKSCDMWVAPLGVDYELYRNTKIDYNLITDKPWSNDYKIMYIGAHGRANNLQAVLDTIKVIEYIFINENYNKKISFIFIGDGEDKTNIISYSEKLNLKNVYFEDAIPGNMVPCYLVHADICLTNLKKIESYKLVRPNKIFQYMALGKPIICGIWGESQSIVENEAKSGIYVDFENPQEAAVKIINMINNNDMLQEYSKNGPAYIEMYGDRSKIYEDYYNRILKLIVEKKEIGQNRI